MNRLRPLLAALFVILCAGAAEAKERVALIIGNADYQLAALDLENPGNDARAIAEKLRTMDFEVILRTDLRRADIAAAMDEFSAAAKEAEMAVVFYAGHGIQKDGQNYLLGTEFSDLTQAALDEASLTLSDVQAAMAAADPRVGIIILDACRNNPFAAQGVVTPGLARASGGAGLLYAYATDPGNVAYDGDGANSQFTAALLRHIDTPGLDVRLMFGRVRQNVILDTQGAQIPWVEDSVIGEHSFSTTPPQQVSTTVAREIERWREISGLPGTEPYREFLAEFPDGIFREFAEARLTASLSPQPALADAGEALEDSSRPAVEAALAVLGFLPPQADGGKPDDTAVRSALQAYTAQSGAETEFDASRLYMDASRTLALLGAKTAQQLRNDMATLSAIETAAEMAEGALEELRVLAENNPDARPILAQARDDVDAIQARRKKILEQLDAGREYYADLLVRARSEFEPMIRSMAAVMTKESRATGSGRGDHKADISMFVRHIALQQDSETEGSYAWMVDFLPE